MKYNPDIHHRRSLRLKGFDYSTDGAYFVTICTYRKELFFEDPGSAKIVQQVWETIPRHHPTVRTDEFVIMPNHVHGILWLSNARRGRMHPAPRQGAMHGAPTTIKRSSLSAVVQNFKAEVTRQIRRKGRIHSAPTLMYFTWQRNYYERVIRNDEELNHVRQYISDNPGNWETDEENPNRKTTSASGVPF